MTSENLQLNFSLLETMSVLGWMEKVCACEQRSFHREVGALTARLNLTNLVGLGVPGQNECPAPPGDLE